MSATAVPLPGDLIAWAEDLAGGRLVHADRKPGGGRKEAWHVDFEGPDGATVGLFLRYDRSDAARTNDPWTLHREASFYLALQGSDVPVPRVLGVHPRNQAMLAERLAGENWFSRIQDAAEQEATARDFMEKLAALHRIDRAALEAAGLAVPATVRDAVVEELDEWDRVIDARGGEPDPALAFTLAWLRRNIPAYDGPVVLVQGDTGPGNFMYAGGKVVALVDWELAHFGDPMDDIAWLSLRATQEPFTDFPARLAEYEALTGNTVDERRVWFYRVMAEAKLQVMRHRPGGPRADAAAEGGGADIGNGLIYGVLHQRLWMEALGEAVGIERTAAEAPPAPEPRDHSWLYDALLAQLQVVVPRIDDPLAQTRTKGFARIVKYLAAVDAHGPFYEACELDDLTELLGAPPPTLAAGRDEIAAAVRAGKVSDLHYLRYLWRRVARETELARPAMGALADRHWPSLTRGAPPPVDPPNANPPNREASL